MPLYITDTLISIQYPQIDGSVFGVDKLYIDLLREYTWQDGTPCGIEEWKLRFLNKNGVLNNSMEKISKEQLLKQYNKCEEASNKLQ